MNNNDYLQSQLLFTPYISSNEDKKLQSRDKKAYVVQKIFRKKFRKQKIYDKTFQDITNKVEISIKENKPLFFAIPFGGYKHFWNPSHPQPDWAEIFSLKFLTDWMAPIVEAHKPGVILEFISEDMIMSKMDNYPPETLETYTKIFESILSLYQKNLPKNLQLRFFRVGKRYDKEKIIEDVDKLLPSSWKQWDTYSNEKKEIELKRSKRSMFWNGWVDLMQLTPADKEKRMIESRLIELAYYTVESYPQYLGNYYIEDNHIGVCFSFGLSPDNDESKWITLGSTYASSVDFWIGRGILERRKDGFINRIISKQQYEKIKDKVQREKVHIDELPFTNYQTVEVINEEDWTRLQINK